MGEVVEAAYDHGEDHEEDSGEDRGEKHEKIGFYKQQFVTNR